MPDTPLHDWMGPRLQKLVDEAIGEGFDPLTVTAVIADIIEHTNLDHQGPTVPPADDVVQAPPQDTGFDGPVGPIGAGLALLGNRLRGRRF